MASLADKPRIIISCFFFFFLSFALVIQSLHVMPVDDDYWSARAALAKNYTDLAYNPNPYDIVDELNAHTHRSLVGLNSTRRVLKKEPHTGPCTATNPIDRCWRCDPNWASNRKRLADCVLGFGKNTIGGKNGRFYVVTDHTDDDVQNPRPGTLRHAVIQKEPLWIIFAHNMIITLKQELIMGSDKTIDGRGVQVRIIGGAGIMMQYVRNIIIHGIYIHNIIPKNGGLIRSSADHVGRRTQSDGDGITIFGSSDIWIDHLSLRRCYDGLIDAIQGSTAITISNCRFTQQNDVMLFGASDSYTEDKKMQITLAFNRFGQAMLQRMPRVRHGFVHIVNNDYTHWRMYAIGGSAAPTIISQGNRFIGGPNKNAKQVTKRDYSTESQWRKWTWRSEGDFFMNGAYFVQSGNPNHRMPGKEYNIPYQPGTMASKLTKFVGALNCPVGKPC